MRIRWLATVMMIATTTLLGCGDGGTTMRPDASVQAEPFELQGEWLYLGPADGAHTLKIGNASMAFADVGGAWSSSWVIKQYDNELHHFQIAFDRGTGTYLPVGQSMSGSYVLNAQILTVQLAAGFASYPSLLSPGSCTEGGSSIIPDCRLYLKQN